MSHPLLRNPTKYLTGVTKQHASELYKTGFYSESIESNPFARILTSTRMDVSGTRFPIGNMVQVIVDKRSNQLVPVLQKPEDGQFPATYLINNVRYLEMLQEKKLRPVSIKYKQRSKEILGGLNMHTVLDGMKGLYEEEIIRELTNIGVKVIPLSDTSGSEQRSEPNASETSEISSESKISEVPDTSILSSSSTSTESGCRPGSTTHIPGLILTPSIEQTMGWRNQTPVFGCKWISQDTFIPFENRLLCDMIIKLAQSQKQVRNSKKQHST